MPLLVEDVLTLLAFLCTVNSVTNELGYNQSVK